MLSQEKTNKILAVLTIVFTPSIPRHSYRHILRHEYQSTRGINTGSWTELGPYTTLIFVLVISSISALIMILYFRSLGWLGSSM